MSVNQEVFLILHSAIFLSLVFLTADAIHRRALFFIIPLTVTPSPQLYIHCKNLRMGPPRVRYLFPSAETVKRPRILRKVPCLIGIAPHFMAHRPRRKVLCCVWFWAVENCKKTRGGFYRVWGYGCLWESSLYSILIYTKSQHTVPFLGGNRVLTLCLELVFCDVFWQVGIWR